MSTSETPTPLREMDPNSRKRKSDDLVESTEGDHPKTLDKAHLSGSAVDETSHENYDTPPKRARTGSSSSLSSVGSLLDADPDASTNSPSPNPMLQSNPLDSKNATPIKSSQAPPSSSGTPASATKAKRKRRTKAELKADEEKKAAEAAERALKKKEAEEKKAVEAVEKAQKKKEREEKKAIADAEKEAKHAEKEAKRMKKEEEERRAREEKEKKERSQMKLNSFFKLPATTPKKAQPAPEAKTSATPQKDDQEPAALEKEARQPSAYEKMFKPFFVKSGCHLATSPFQMDKEARDAKSRILDEYISGRRGDLEPRKFDVVEAFALVGPPKPRGMLHEPVKETVEYFRHAMQKAESRGIEDQEKIRSETRKRLARVPLKSIRFQQDVRPPYFGTITHVPHTVGLSRMRKVARNPTNPVLPLQYEYDSEAEWQDEEGEDLDGDDDDEEDIDDGDEVAGLIDDSDAVDLLRFGATGLEPSSTGMCWENRQRLGPAATMYKHRLEFILPTLDHHHTIDPFSSAYWEPEPAPKPKSTATNAFQQISSTTPAAAAAESDKAKTKKTGAPDLPAGLSDEDLATIKKTIISTYETTPRISKLGMLELLKSSALDGVKVNGKDISRNDVKTVIDVVSLRKMKGGEVLWSLKPEHAL